MDVFSFPSYREGLCLVLMEAGAMNVPSISSDIVGCSEVVCDYQNGLLIKSKNIQDLQEKMQYYIHNPKEKNRMSKLSRSIIKDKFEQQKLWKKSLEVYQKIADN